MSENDSPREIYDKLKQANKILLSLHFYPDGDSLGSCCAMKYFLEKELNKEVKIISYFPVSSSLEEIPFANEVDFGIDITDVNLEDFDLLLLCDTSSEELIGKIKPNYKIPDKIFVINIDHHSSNSYYGNLNYVFPNKSSTCSVLLGFFEEICIDMDRELATRLLLGICTDSSFFKTRNAESAIKDACKLIDLGADYQLIVQKILFNEKLELKKFFSLVVDKIKVNEEKKFCYSVISYYDIKNLGLTGSELRLGINELLSLRGFDFVFTIIELEDSIKVSFRSSKGFDVSVFAKALGGGGHKGAASAFFEKMPLESVEESVLSMIDKLYPKKE